MFLMMKRVDIRYKSNSTHQNGKKFSRKDAKDAKKILSHILLLVLNQKKILIQGSLCALCVFARVAFYFRFSRVRVD